MLLEALRILEVSATLVSNCDSIASLSLPNNVDVYLDVVNIRFNDLMARTDVVAFPLKSANFNAGQSVVPQAMCYGKPIVFNGDARISEYIENVISGLFALPDEAKAMATVVHSKLVNPKLPFSVGTEIQKKYWGSIFS